MSETSENKTRRKRNLEEQLGSKTPQFPLALFSLHVGRLVSICSKTFICASGKEIQLTNEIKPIQRQAMKREQGLTAWCDKALSFHFISFVSCQEK